MRFIAFDEQGDCVASGDFFSIGGGFVIGKTEMHENGKITLRRENEMNSDLVEQEQNVISSAFPFSNAERLLQICKRENMSIAQMVYQNELQWRSKEEIKKKVSYQNNVKLISFFLKKL